MFILDGSTFILQMPLVGTPSTEWCRKRSFSHKSDSGLLSNSWGRLRLAPFHHFLSNLQQQTNAQLTVVVVNHWQLAKINKTKENSENKVIGERTKSKIEQQ
jgi:hypothetical protein